MYRQTDGIAVASTALAMRALRRAVKTTRLSVTEVGVAGWAWSTHAESRKADIIGNCKYVTTGRKFTVGYNVAKLVAAASTGRFLVYLQLTRRSYTVQRILD